MQDTELFLSLAEIAGVFVGFGALIAIRSGGESDPFEVGPMRGVVLAGMMTIIAALAPVTIGRYHLTGHQVLALSSILVLVSYGALGFIHRHTPEYAVVSATLSGRPRRIRLAENVAAVTIMGGPILALIAIVLGVAPELEAAVYFTVVVLLLVQAAWTLLWLVFSQRRSQMASGPAVLPAAGGSSG